MDTETATAPEPASVGLPGPGADEDPPAIPGPEADAEASPPAIFDTDATAPSPTASEPASSAALRERDAAPLLEDVATPPSDGEGGEPLTPTHLTASLDQELAEIGFAEAPVRPDAQWAAGGRGASALTWIDAESVSTGSIPIDFGAAPTEAEGPDLLADARLRPGWLRARALVPTLFVVSLAAAYCGSTLLWPLDNVAPTVTAAKVEIAPAAAASIAWPTSGSAAVGVQGMGTASSGGDREPIASISKVASSLMVLDALPLKPGEEGPSYAFTRQDSLKYWQYRRSDQSALDVPAGGSLTEHQMLEGVLLGSANNYIDRLAREIWGSEGAFADASAKWLRDHGLGDISLPNPSGFDSRNVASASDLVTLGELAMRNQVFADIVGTPQVELPGAGVVKNTNRLLAEDAGVVGIKTGTLGKSWNLLTAKDITVDGKTVRLFAAVLGQHDDDARVDATRALFAEVEKALASQTPAVPKGTVVGTLTTEWGARSDIITDTDAKVALWNGATATAKSDLSLGDDWTKGAKTGTLTATGPLGSAEASVSLRSQVDDPSPWWRLTHPMQLFGLD